MLRSLAEIGEKWVEKQTPRSRAIAFCAFLVAALGGFGAGVARAQADSPPTTAVTLEVDYSSLPSLTIHARGVSTDELMSSLGQKMGFTVKRIGRADSELRVRGRFVGELPELLPFLLRTEGYVATFAGDGPGERRVLEKLFLLDSHPTEGTGPAASPAAARQIRTYLEANPQTNKDLRKSLANLADRLERGDLASDVVVNLSDVPETVTDVLLRINEPLAPDFAQKRLENRAPGTPPNYLTGANDAAQHDVDSALSRTSAMARRNAEMLSRALERACFDEDCPGITRAQIAEREARETLKAQEAAAAKEAVKAE